MLLVLFTSPWQFLSLSSPVSPVSLAAPAAPVALLLAPAASPGSGRHCCSHLQVGACVKISLSYFYWHRLKGQNKESKNRKYSIDQWSKEVRMTTKIGVENLVGLLLQAVWRIQNVLIRIRIPPFKLMRIRIQNLLARERTKIFFKI